MNGRVRRAMRAEKKKENPFSMPVIFFYAEFSTPSEKYLSFCSKNFLTPENDVDFCLRFRHFYGIKNTHIHT
jgi:hypothetical protein